MLKHEGNTDVWGAEEIRLPADIDAQPLVQAAAALRPVLRSYHEQIEREQRLPSDAVCYKSLNFLNIWRIRAPTPRQIEQLDPVAVGLCPVGHQPGAVDAQVVDDEQRLVPRSASAMQTDNSKRTGGSMTTYIMLAHWTDRGMQAVADGPKRMDQAKKMLEDMGGRMQSLYLTMGQYDLVGIFDAPDDAIAARFTLMIGQLGNVRTTTMKAFPEEAYRHIVDSLR
jgi:uncharacterized protein with GYD domain